jgi:crotonobetainyl-CoA:carnitine CoA-transferase CaiB-like acyl-CoA transferase
VATARSANHEELDDLIGRWTAGLPLATLEKVLAEAGVPATRIFTMADIFADPHYRARGAIVRAPDPDLDTVAMANVVPRLSETPGQVRHAGHDIGGDTRRVLRDLLGLSAEQIDTLQAQGVIDCASPCAATGDETRP